MNYECFNIHPTKKSPNKLSDHSFETDGKSNMVKKLTMQKLNQRNPPVKWTSQQTSLNMRVYDGRASQALEAETFEKKERKIDFD